MSSFMLGISGENLFFKEYPVSLNFYDQEHKEQKLLKHN